MKNVVEELDVVGMWCLLCWNFTTLLNGIGNWCFLFEGKRKSLVWIHGYEFGVWLLYGQGGGSIGVIFWWWWWYFRVSVGISIGE